MNISHLTSESTSKLTKHDVHTYNLQIKLQMVTGFDHIQTNDNAFFLNFLVCPSSGIWIIDFWAETMLC